MTLQQCPHPGCTHIGEVITNNHAITRHNMTRIQLFAKYGQARKVEMDNAKLRANSVSQEKSNWNRKFG